MISAMIDTSRRRRRDSMKLPHLCDRHNNAKAHDKRHEEDHISLSSGSSSSLATLLLIFYFPLTGLGSGCTCLLVCVEQCCG